MIAHLEVEPVGGHIPIQATIFTRRNGSRIFDFNIDGIYDAPKGFDTSAFMMLYLPIQSRFRATRMSTSSTTERLAAICSTSWSCRAPAK